MLHSNVAELRLLLDTFTRVWSSGGQANISLQTKDSQMWAKMDLQLGPADGRRPGAPEAEGRVGAELRNHRAQPHLPRQHCPALSAQQTLAIAILELVMNVPILPQKSYSTFI